jgi:transcriptional regulator with XRE-family HTH domain
LRAVAESRDDDRIAAVYQAVDQAVRSATKLAPRTTLDMWKSPLGASFGEIIGANLKSLRNRAGWSQERLAGAMSRAGYDWKRITMAQVEAGTRRISLEELAGLSALFGIPLVFFLVPTDLALDLPAAQVQPDQVKEVLLGRGGRLGKGGSDWSVAFDVLPSDADIERPAPDLEGKS